MASNQTSEFHGSAEVPAGRVKANLPSNTLGSHESLEMLRRRRSNFTLGGDPNAMLAVAAAPAKSEHHFGANSNIRLLIGFWLYSAARRQRYHDQKRRRCSESRDCGNTMAYLRQMGVSPEVMDIAGSTAPGKISILDAETMRRTGIANLYWRTKGWKIEPRKKGAAAISEVAYGPSFTASAEVYCKAGQEQRANLTIAVDLAPYLKWLSGPPYVSGIDVIPIGNTGPTIGYHRPTSEKRFPIERSPIRGGIIYLTVDITNELPTLVAAKGFSVKLRAGMVFHRFFSDVVTLTGIHFPISASAASKVALTLRNCI